MKQKQKLFFLLCKFVKILSIFQSLNILQKREVNHAASLMRIESQFHSFSACDWLFAIDVTTKLLNSGSKPEKVDGTNKV